MHHVQAGVHLLEVDALVDLRVQPAVGGLAGGDLPRVILLVAAGAVDLHVVVGRADAAAVHHEVDAAALDVGDFRRGLGMPIEDRARQREDRDIAVVGGHAVEVERARRLGEEHAVVRQRAYQAARLERGVDLEETQLVFLER